MGGVQLLKKVEGSFNKSQVLITHINPLKMVLQKVEAPPFVRLSFNQSDPSKGEIRLSSLPD